jgi:TetR/AcrR family transcriptional regulator
MTNRTTILETALAFFAAFGYEATGTLEICDAAGVSKPTMYYYFKSKHGLMEVILTENFEPFPGALKEATPLPTTISRLTWRRSCARISVSRRKPSLLPTAVFHAVRAAEERKLRDGLPWVKRQRELIQTLFRRASRSRPRQHARHVQQLTRPTCWA